MIKNFEIKKKVVVAAKTTSNCDTIPCVYHLVNFINNRKSIVQLSHYYMKTSIYSLSVNFHLGLKITDT